MTGFPSRSTVSPRDVTGWTDEMEAVARDKFAPLILSVGAERVQMIRTDDLTICVVTEYASAEAAAAARERIAEIRNHAAEKLPITMSDAFAGAVFAHG